LGEEEYRKNKRRRQPEGVALGLPFRRTLRSDDRDLAEGQDFIPGGTDFAHPSVQVVSKGDALTIGRML
jgi:hypothetical protein